MKILYKVKFGFKEKVLKFISIRVLSSIGLALFYFLDSREDSSQCNNVLSLHSSRPDGIFAGISTRVTMKHTGSCLCKRIVFEIEGEFEDFYLCHCSRCRKDTGSSHASNLFSSSAKITWISGEEQVKTYRVEGTHHSKSFCPHCGSALPTSQMGGSLLVVPAGSLDSDPHISPKGHIYVQSRASWDNNLEKIPQYPKQPPIKETS